ncbi:EFHB protein, partial [Alcedo cyanopectus]|nr:EFHB protein [Ceyx cyanopectus]
VASVINPLPKTNFQQKIEAKKEAIYFSNRHAPLGRSHDQSSMLPHGLDVINSVFGKKVIKDVSAGELVNPPKTLEEVDKEAREGHDLYVVSHNDYYVEERINRRYDSPNFSKSSVFGRKTPHFRDGRGVAKSLNWLCDLQSAENQHLKTEILLFIKTLSHLKKKKALSIDGQLMDEVFIFTGVGDLLRSQATRELLCAEGREKAILTAVRQSLKRASYDNLDTLLKAFRHYDKNGDGMIDKKDLQKSFFQLNIDVDEELLDSLFDCCDWDKDGLINYLEFTKFLNWKDRTVTEEFEEKIIARGKNLDVPALPEGTNRNDEPLLKQQDLELKEVGSSEKPPNKLTGSKDHVLGYYRTTSSQYNAVVGGLPTTCYAACGVPSIRADLPAPATRRVGDSTNYGDGATAFELLFPSVLSQKGVYGGDLLKARPKEEV